MQQLISIVASFLDSWQCVPLRALSKSHSNTFHTPVHPLASEIFKRAVTRSSLFTLFGRAPHPCAAVRFAHHRKCMSIILSGAARVDDVQLAQVCFINALYDARASNTRYFRRCVRKIDMIPRVGMDWIFKLVDGVAIEDPTFERNSTRVFRAYWHYWRHYAEHVDVAAAIANALRANNEKCARFLFTSIQNGALGNIKKLEIEFANQVENYWNVTPQHFDLSFINFLTSTGNLQWNENMGAKNAATALHLIKLGAPILVQNLALSASAHNNVGLLTTIRAVANTSFLAPWIGHDCMYFRYAVRYSRAHIIRALTAVIPPPAEDPAYFFNVHQSFVSIEAAHAISDYFIYWFRTSHNVAQTSALQSMQILNSTCSLAARVFQQYLAMPYFTPCVWHALTRATFETETSLRPQIISELVSCPIVRTFEAAQILVSAQFLLARNRPLKIANPIQLFLLAPPRIARFLFDEFARETAPFTIARVGGRATTIIKNWEHYSAMNPRATSHHQAYIMREFIARGFIAPSQELAVRFLCCAAAPNAVVHEILMRMSADERCAAFHRALPRLCQSAFWQRLEYVIDDIPLACADIPVPNFYFLLPTPFGETEKIIGLLSMRSRALSGIAQVAAHHLSESNFEDIVTTFLREPHCTYRISRILRALKRRPLPRLVGLLRFMDMPEQRFEQLQIEIEVRARARKKTRHLFTP